MTASLAELYQDPALSEQANRWVDIWTQGYVGTILGQIGTIATIAGEAAMVAQLERLTWGPYERTPSRVANLLGALPANALLSNFGEEVMGWAFANDERARTEQLGQQLKAEGYDPQLLNAARVLSHLDQDPSKPISGKCLLAQYAVMESVFSPRLQSIDLPALLDRSAVSGVTISEKRANDYRLLPVRIRPGGSDLKISGRVEEWQGKDAVERHPEPGQGLGLWYDLWLDVFAGFIATYKGAPQMLVGVCARGTNELMIAQWQRLRGSVYDPAQELLGGDYKIVDYKPARGLMPLDWPRLATGIAARLANQLGMQSVGIKRASAIPSQESDIPLEHAVKVYDDNAARLLFTRGEDRDWHRPTSELL